MDLSALFLLCTIFIDSVRPLFVKQIRYILFSLSRPTDTVIVCSDSKCRNCEIGLVLINVLAFIAGVSVGTA